MSTPNNPVYKITIWSGGRLVRTFFGENISFCNESCSIVRLDNERIVYVSRPYIVEELSAKEAD